MEYDVGWHQSPADSQWYFYYGGGVWSAAHAAPLVAENKDEAAAEQAAPWEKYLELENLPARYKDDVGRASVKMKRNLIRVIYPLNPNRNGREWLEGWRVHLTLFSLSKDTGYRFDQFHVTYENDGRSVHDFYRLPNYDGPVQLSSAQRYGLEDKSRQLSDTFAKRFVERLQKASVEKLKKSDCPGLA